MLLAHFGFSTLAGKYFNDTLNFDLSGLAGGTLRYSFLIEGRAGDFLGCLAGCYFPDGIARMMALPA